MLKASCKEQRSVHFLWTKQLSANAIHSAMCPKVCSWTKTCW